MSLLSGAARPDPVAYMSEVAASGPGRALRDRVLRDMDLRPGLTVLDGGCGPGTNLEDLANAVTATGTVIGLDRDPVMVAEARRRMAPCGWAGVLLGDAHALPVGDGCVHRARVDRVLQHVASPAGVLAELRRVSRRGALITLTEPDWATLAIDAADLPTSWDFTRYTCSEVVRNASIGRQLARLAAAAGFTIRSVAPYPPLFGDFREADRILGLTRNSVAAIAAGYLEEARAQRWLAALSSEPFLATVMIFTVIAEAA